MFSFSLLRGKGKGRRSPKAAEGGGDAGAEGGDVGAEGPGSEEEKTTSTNPSKMKKLINKLF